MRRVRRFRRLSRLRRFRWIHAPTLRAHAQFARLRILDDLLRSFRIADWLAILELPGLGDFLLPKGTSLVLNDLPDLEVRVVLDEGVVRGVLGVPIGKLGLVLGRADLDDVLDRIADLLQGIILGDLPVYNTHRNGVLDLALLACLNNLGFTRLQFRVDAHLDFERSLLSPLNRGGGRLALGADLDDLLDRLGHTHGFGLGIHNLRVLDGQCSGDLVLTELTFLNSFLLSGFHRVIEDDLGLERHVLFVLRRVSAFGLGANADYLLGWFLGALRSHNRVARRLTVHDLLRRGLNLGANFTLLVNNLPTSLEFIVEDDLGLERNRLLSLGHQLARRQARAVLDDPLDRLLGGLFLSNLSFRALGGELGGVGLLSVLTFLNNPGFTRLQVQVLTNLGRVRDRNRPRDLLGSLGGLRADDHDLVDWCLGLFPATVLVLLFRTRLALGFNLVGASGDSVVVLVLDVERDLTGRDFNNVHHCESGVGRAVLVGHCDWNLDLVTRLRIRRCGCGDLAIVINGGLPTRRDITQLVRAVLGNVDVVRLVELQRQRGELAWVHRLYRVGGLCFPVVGQLHHSDDGHQRGGAVRSRQSDVDGLLVTRLGVCRRGGGYDTGVRVDRVLPAVDFLVSNRRAIFVRTERILRTLRCVLDVVLHSLVRAGGLHVVHRSEVALQDDDGALHCLRLVSIVVVREDRDVQDVALGGGLRNRRGDNASVLVDLDGPCATVIGNRLLVLAVLEGVTLRSLVGRVTTQATFRELRPESDLGGRLTSDRVVIGDLDVNDRLELSLDLIGGAIRVGRLHLRGDDGARRHSVISFGGDLSGLIDGHGPAFRNTGLVDLKLSRVNRLVALHDGLGTHLGGEVDTDVALHQTRAH